MPRISLFQSRPPSPSQSSQPTPALATTSKNTVKNALVILEKAVDGLPIPGLKAAIGSLVEIIKIVDKAKQNQDALQELIVLLRNLGDAIITAFLDYQHMDIPSALEARVNRLSTALSALAHDWQRLKTAHTFTHRFINYEDYSLAVNDMNRRIKESLHTFLLENQIASTIVIENIQRTVSKHVLSTEIRSLPRVSASYNSVSRTNSPTCFKGTREGVLNDFRTWFYTGSTFMYVLLGIAGVGKSTIAQTIAALISGEGRLAASFFFSRYEADRNTTRLFFSSLAFQLAQQSEDFAARIGRALQVSPDAPQQTLLEQLQKLIIDPLNDLPDSTPPMLIVLDALDECGEDDAAQLLRFLLAELVRLPFIKVFITTRPEPLLKSILDKAQSRHGLILHDVEKSVVAEDIGRFLEYQLSSVEVEKVLPDCRLTCRPEDIEALTLSAGQLFIVASTYDKFIKDRNVRNPQRQLGKILGTVEMRGGTSVSPFSMLDRLYAEILEEAVPGNDQDSDIIERFQNVVGTIIALQDPLSQESLATFLGLEIDDVVAALSLLQSVIVPYHEDPCPRVYHPSFPDFITNPARCKDKKFLIETPKHHGRLAGLCLDVMDNLLKRNICNLSYPEKFMENKDNPELPSKIKTNIPAELAYACSFWAVHLSKCVDPGEELMKKLERFAFKNLLFWLEVLSLIGRMDDAYPAVLYAQKFANHPGAPSELIIILKDAQRFVMSSQEIMRMSALHVYYSALPFAPYESTLMEKYKDLAESSVKILMGQDKNWDPLLAVLAGHLNGAMSIAYSPDGTRLASASDDKTVRLWDVATGAPLAKLEGHSSWVISVAFSPDGTRLASASSDKTVRLWDAATGAPLTKLQGHSSEVTSAAFSPDGTRLTSASWDLTVRVWDAATGAPLAKLEGHSSFVTSAVFSPDGTRLASASMDKTVRLWDAATGAPLAELEGHSNSVTSAVFSPDGTRLASTSLDKTVRLWDAATGAPLAKLQGHSSGVTTAVFSPDGTRLASESDYNTVRLWDTATGASLAEYTGTLSVTSTRTLSVSQPNGDVQILWAADQTKQLPLQDSACDPLHPTTNYNFPSQALLLLRDNRDRSFVIYNLFRRGQQTFVRIPLCWLPFAFVNGQHDWKGTVLGAGFGNGRMLFLDMSPAILQQVTS